MKTITLALILFVCALDLRAQSNVPPQFRRVPRTATNGVAPAAFPSFPSRTATPPATMPGMPSPSVPVIPTSPGNAAAAGFVNPNSSSASAEPEEMIQPGIINFQGVDVNQVLDVYAKLVHRTVLRAGLPSAQIVLKTENALTKSEAIQALQAVLLMNGVALINIGDKFVKALPVDQANGGGGEFNKASTEQMPNLGTYVTRIIQLHYLKPSEIIPAITPFSKLPNSILAIDSNQILILRDAAENVKRMMEMIDQIDVSVPAEYISEVIPIKYAQAEDIASALNSLGGTGGGSVSIGASGNASPISGMGGARSGGGMGGMGGMTTPGGGSYGGSTGSRFGSQGATTPSPTPATGSSFQQRLNQIINRAAGGGGSQDQIQVFGQAKIVTDQRSNSLLVFATRQDMEAIKKVISELDVLLSQVLIESVIMDVSLNHNFSFGVSVAQNPKALSSTVTTAGGNTTGTPFMNFLKSTSSNGVTSIVPSGSGSNSFPGNLTSILPGNSLSYFANIGPTWDVAMQAIAADSSVTVIQRPRIQTSQAKQAQFFVGNTVPYITGVSYGTGYSGANSSSYSQLSVGVELDVTPFINPEGLVVMDVNQEIDDISGYTTIDNNSVPTTVKRTLTSEIAVKDRDTIILGGFIRSDKSKSKTGIPFLQDIPLLGNLFTQRNDTKGRQELVVLMRPTVLRSPDAAALQAIKEQERLPGVSAAAADDAAYEKHLIEMERKAELKRHKGVKPAMQNLQDVPTINDTNAAPAAR